jgi:mitochondrial chaperone BCS1
MMLDPIWLFLGGLVLRYGGDLAKFIAQFSVQRFTSTITIAETNPVYGAICWQLDRTGKVRDFNELIYSIAPAIPTAISAPALSTKLQPRNGWVGMSYRGAYFVIYRHDFKVTDVQTTQLLSLFTLRPWQPILFEWLDELEKSYSREAPLTVRLYGASSAIVRTQTKRQPETLALEPSLAAELFTDLDRFLDSRQIYAQRGIPWRRGYLFYGPPGTGKTSLVQAIASQYDRQLVSLSLADMDDSALLRAWSEISASCVIALEDIDSVFAGRKSLGKLSFSTLLNSLDGVGAVEGTIAILTTNHRDRLDPALIRPGRCDREFELGYLSAATCARMFDRFFPHTDFSADIAAKLGDAKIAPAVWQSYLQQFDRADVAAADCDFTKLAAGISRVDIDRG